MLLQFIALAFTINNYNFHKSKFISSTNFISGTVLGVSSNISNYFKLKSENEILSNENNYLRNQLALLQQKDSFSENQIIDTTKYQQKYNYINGRIIRNEFRNTANFLTIAIGKKKGVSKEMAVINDKGIRYMPNFPTQEVFCAPKQNGINGCFKNSKPLWYQNKKIDDFYLIFNKGEVVDYGASENYLVLKDIIEYDEYSKYAGEIAILPGVTEISKSGILFNTTLLDENAACHLALGCAYPCSFNGSVEYNKTSYKKHQMNYSGIHVDMMFGTEQINIKGVDCDGNVEDIIVDGEWVI